MINKHNPDVLSCLANLSNDEVFTPPEVVNRMLDLLPQELFESPKTTFLDPCCKTGVFLREIAKRLLSNQMPGYEKVVEEINAKKAEHQKITPEDKWFMHQLQEVVDHIFHKQLFGIAITEITSLVSRRSVYCSKWPNGKYSVSKFDTPEGNIRFKRINHTWVGGKCKYCGASEEQYSRGDTLETHAYEWIHTENPEGIFNMKFDVIISNPPYQMSFGIEGTNSANAKSIYNLFIQQSLKLKSHYLVMITPSRWMTKTAQGIPESWVDVMLHSNHFKIIHDFEDATDCFPGVEIMGGVNYFLYDKDFIGKCDYFYHQKGINEPLKRFDFLDSKNAGIVLRDPQSYSIIEKIIAVEGNYFSEMTKNFSGLVSPKHFFDDSNYLTSNWKGYKDNQNEVYSIKYYLNLNKERTFKWISQNQLPKNKETKDFHKVYIPAANGSLDVVLGQPFYGEPNSVCSQTYLVIGYDKSHNLTKENCMNIITYIKTKFFRYLVSIKKKTQNGPRGVYQFVPLQDFSKPWTDEELYKKYKLTKGEINYIESMIRPME